MKLLGLGLVCGLILSSQCVQSRRLSGSLRFNSNSGLSESLKDALRLAVEGPVPDSSRGRLLSPLRSSAMAAVGLQPRDEGDIVDNDIDDGDEEDEGTPIDVDEFGSDLPEGYVCMEKEVLVEEITYDTEMKCEHISQESCFESYTTTFKAGKTEECDVSFEKQCQIEYHKVPKREKVQVCNEALTRDCDVPEEDAETVCSKEYETICETVFMENEVEETIPVCETIREEECFTNDLGEEICNEIPREKCELETQLNTKVTPKTECKNVEREVCGPEMCPLVKGPKICEDKIKLLVQNVPSEECSLIPRKTCNVVSKVIPVLEPVKHCINVPKEVCANSRVNPVRTTKPIVKKWCGPNPNAGDDGDEDDEEETPESSNLVIAATQSGLSYDIKVFDMDANELVCDAPAELAGIYNRLEAALVDEGLIICGGENVGADFPADKSCSIMRDDGIGFETLEPGISISAPDGIFNSASLYDSNQKKWILFGGEDSAGQTMASVYTLEKGETEFSRVPYTNFFSDERLHGATSGGCAGVLGEDSYYYFPGNTETNSPVFIFPDGEVVFDGAYASIGFCGVATQEDGQRHLIVVHDSDTTTSYKIPESAAAFSLENQGVEDISGTAALNKYFETPGDASLMKAFQNGDDLVVLLSDTDVHMKFNTETQSWEDMPLAINTGSDEVFLVQNISKLPQFCDEVPL